MTRKKGASEKPIDARLRHGFAVNAAPCGLLRDGRGESTEIGSKGFQ